MISLQSKTSGYTLDTIFSGAFGTQTNVNESSGRNNPLLIHAIKLMSSSTIRMTAFYAFPTKLNTLFGNPVALDLEGFNFFINFAKEILKQRQAAPEAVDGSTKRNDLFQLMMDAFAYEDDLKGENYDKLTSDEGTAESGSAQDNLTSSTAAKAGQAKKRLTESEIIAQCIIFTLAGKYGIYQVFAMEMS